MDRTTIIFLLSALLVLIPFNKALKSPSGTGICRDAQLEVVAEPVGFGEGPHWSAALNSLLYVDIDAGLLLKYNATSGELARIFVPPGALPVTFVIPVEGSDDRNLAVSRRREVLETRLDVTDVLTVVRTVSQVEDDKPENRFNEARADTRGRLFAGTVGPEGPNGEIPSGGRGSLYRLNADASFTTIDVGIDVSNGLAWSLDNTKLYYIDTGVNRVDVFDYDIQTGAATNRRLAFDLAQNNVTGVPDSMSIDADGRLWIACYAGSQVIVVEPESGTLLGSIQFPVTLVTSAVFGGVNYDELYVTTSRHLLTDEQLQQQPFAGSLFRVTGLGHRGLPANRVVLPTVRKL